MESRQPESTRWKPAAGRALALIAAAALLAAAQPADAGAAELTVTRLDDPLPGPCQAGDCSLREAVIAANGQGGLDTIRLAAGTYALTQPRPPSGDFGFAQVGDLDIADALEIVGPATSEPAAGGGIGATIDGNGGAIGDRVFEIDGGASLTLSRLRILDGEAQRTDDSNGDEVPDFARGGAVRVEAGATLTLEHALFSGNTANSFGQGGAIYNDGLLSASETRFTLNEAVDGFSGAIHTEPGATTSLLGTEIDANRASFGGGLGAYGVTTVEDSAFLGNHGGIGGAIRAGGGNSLVTLTNTTLAHNDATGGGSAIRARNGPGLFLNAVTIARNVADADGIGGGDAAIALRRDGLATTARLHNTILAANRDGSPGTTDVPDCTVSGGASIVLAGHDLLGDLAGCLFATPIGAEGNLVPSGGETIDPGLAPAAADNGGPTETLALLAGSPAIDAGSAAPPGPAPACPDADQRGAPRSRCDIGAYELQLPEPPVDPGLPGSGDGAIRPSGADDVVAVEIRGRSVRLRGRRAIVRLACPASELSPPCAGSLRLRTAGKVGPRGKRRRVTLAGRRFSIGAGRTLRVGLRLAEGRATLARSRPAARRVRAIARVADAAGNRATIAKRMRLRLSGPLGRGRR